MPPVAAAVSPVRKSRVEKHGRELAVGGSVGRRTQRKPRRRQGAHHPRHTQKPRRQPKARRSGKDRNKTKHPLRSQDRRGCLISYIVCRSDRIRTCDPLLPKQMRYRTALRPENELQNWWRREGDSNPRYSIPYDSLANCWFQPLTHLSNCADKSSAFYCSCKLLT